MAKSLLKQIKHKKNNNYNINKLLINNKLYFILHNLETRKQTDHKDNDKRT